MSMAGPTGSAPKPPPPPNTAPPPPPPTIARSRDERITIWILLAGLVLLSLAQAARVKDLFSPVGFGYFIGGVIFPLLIASTLMWLYLLVSRRKGRVVRADAGLGDRD